MIRVVVVREPEFDEEQYRLLAALAEHEASLNELGIPRDEAMSIDADPENREGKWRYRAKPLRDWSLDALEQKQKDPAYSGDNYSRARLWTVERMER